MLIRPETANDYAAVADLQNEVFSEVGNDPAAYVSDLRASLTAEQGLSLVAIHEDEIVGHALFTRNILDTPKRLVDVQVLSPLGVLSAHQGKGIGTTLVNAGVDELANRNVPMVILEGSPTYYVRMGFTPGRQLGLRKPSLRIPDEAFQVRTLPAYESWMTGTLVYRQEFWDHDAVGLRESPQITE